MSSQAAVKEKVGEASRFALFRTEQSETLLPSHFNRNL